MKPHEHSYRSFIYRYLERPGARFVPGYAGAVAADFGDADAEKRQAGELALADLTPMPRLGFKGPDIPGWLQDKGVNLPQQPNTSGSDQQSGRVARLGHTEILLLGNDDDSHGQRLDELAAAWKTEAADGSLQGNILLRQHSHAWFALCGLKAPDTLAKLCAVDLRPAAFTQGGVVLTSVARVSAILIRQDSDAGYACHILVDSSYAAYLWNCLNDAMTEFGGTVTGAGAVYGVAER